jgi:ribosomal protein S27AE
MDGYIYICYTREFKLLNETIYKIGRTIDINKRIYGYSKGSIMLLVIECNNHIQAEKDILKLFDNDFIKCKEYGNEYFSGDLNLMQDVILSYFKNKIFKLIKFAKYEDDNKDKNIEKKMNCPRCGYSTNRKDLFLSHINRLSLCEPSISNCTLDHLKILYEKKDKLHKCKCGLSYTHKSSYYRHTKICTGNTTENTTENTTKSENINILPTTSLKNCRLQSSSTGALSCGVLSVIQYS